MTKKPILKQMATLLQRWFTDVYPGTTWVFTREDIHLLCRFTAANYYEGKLMQELCRQPEMAQAMEDLNCMLGAGRILISENHENAGLAWLWQTRDRFEAPLGAAEVRVLRRVEGFRFMGVAVRPAGGTHSYMAAPIYKVIGDTGSFTYEAWSWQSGAKPRLVN